MKVDLYNQKGEVIDQINVSDRIFGYKWNSVLVHQVLVALQSNKRKPIAHAKDRGEVSGGGRKPWRQKGTGRARHGSIRSPLWIGGGVTFGPTKEKKYDKKINKKTKLNALLSVLSKKFSDQEIKIIDKIELEQPKTKEMAKILKNFLNDKKRNQGLLILPTNDRNLIKSTRNLSFAQATTIENLDLINLLTFKNLIFIKEAVEKLEEKIK
ncbi:MAG: 50S ribosomal protein L4 [Patescibacteria group bacterium]|jgi:large subunit ribosomal protein L4|nr:50S ribosomal protein L4 [Patescibacteria group bacterium]